MAADTPLTQYLRLQRATDTDVLAMLRSSYTATSRELRRLEASTVFSDAVRADQLRFTIVEIQRQMAVFWTGVGNVTKAQRAEAAATAAEGVWRHEALSAALGPDKDLLLRGVRAAARVGLETALERLSGSSYVPLAKSVYQNQALTSGHIDRLVSDALARGASARELARDVRPFINPNVRGGVRYAATRLARTELNNAFHAAQIRSAIESPWVDFVKWNLSGSHKVPDDCNVYATQDNVKGQPGGVWKPEDVPSKPHPQCLCFLTTISIPRDDFLSQFRAGSFDSAIDQMMTTGRATFR